MFYTKIIMKLKKLYKFPTPVELGMSKTNAMPIKLYSKNTTGYTWDDYENHLRIAYPYKYKVYEIINSIVLHINIHLIMRIYNAYWWVRYHTINRYHTLSLVQKEDGTVDSYKFGYRDTADRMTYAIFNLLDEYMKHRTPITKKQAIENHNLQKQYKLDIELISIHTWWHVHRKEDLLELDNMLSEWSILRNEENDSENENKLFKDMNRFETDIDLELTDKMIRLVQLRNKLWS